MNVIHYLKQFATWFNRTPVANFVYRLTAFCCAILVYAVVMSLMLMLLLLLALYKLSFGLVLPKQQRDFNNMNPNSEKTNKHFSEHSLPVLPKW